jgi:hypothetical protein
LKNGRQVQYEPPGFQILENEENSLVLSLGALSFMLRPEKKPPDSPIRQLKHKIRKKDL